MKNKVDFELTMKCAKTVVIANVVTGNAFMEFSNGIVEVWEDFESVAFIDAVTYPEEATRLFSEHVQKHWVGKNSTILHMISKYVNDIEELRLYLRFVIAVLESNVPELRDTQILLRAKEISGYEE